MEKSKKQNVNRDGRRVLKMDGLNQHVLISWANHEIEASQDVLCRRYNWIPEDALKYKTSLEYARHVIANPFDF